jgi:hypothetical protein
MASDDHSLKNSALQEYFGICFTLYVCMDMLLRRWLLSVLSEQLLPGKVLSASYGLVSSWKSLLLPCFTQE